MPSYSIMTYGCSNNQAESEIMTSSLKKAGFVSAPAEQADIVILNTCSVKNITENKIIRAAKELEAKNKKFILTGCMPEAQYNVVKEILPEAGMVSTHHIDKIAEAAESMLDNEYVEILGKSKIVKAALPKVRKNPIVDIIPISSGCASFCTFCSTKLAKGNLFSYPIDVIVESVKNGLKEGVKEFWLTSQDNGCYGFDSGKNLSDLINAVVCIEGDYMVRIGMMNPEHTIKILPDLLEAYKDPRIFKFFHLPVQSGSNQVLEKMKRRHTKEDYVQSVESIRQKFQSVIWTDMICGFPEETEEDFSFSMELLKQTQPDFCNVSAYGNRPGTVASKMIQFDNKTKRARTKQMSSLVQEISKNQNKKWLGWKGSAIVDEYNLSKQTWIARNDPYKKIILNENSLHLGQKINVKITDAKHNHLIGEVMSVSS